MYESNPDHFQISLYICLILCNSHTRLPLNKQQDIDEQTILEAIICRWPLLMTQVVKNPLTFKQFILHTGAYNKIIFFPFIQINKSMILRKRKFYER